MIAGLTKFLNFLGIYATDENFKQITQAFIRQKKDVLILIKAKIIGHWNTDFVVPKNSRFLKRVLDTSSVNAWKWTSHRVSLDFLLRKVNEFFLCLCIRSRLI